MTDRPTNRIPGRPAGRGGNRDARTQRVYQHRPAGDRPASKFRGDGSELPPRANSLAWSQGDGPQAPEPGHYRETGGDYPGGYEPYPPATPDPYAGANNDAPQRKPWFRLAPNFLVAAAAVAVVAAGGGLAYTLTGSAKDSPAPAPHSVAPAVPQQFQSVVPAPSVAASVPVQSPVPVPDSRSRRRIPCSYRRRMSRCLG